MWYAAIVLSVRKGIRHETFAWHELGNDCSKIW